MSQVSRSRSRTRSVSREKAPARERGLRKGLYIFNALLNGPATSKIEDIARFVSEKVFGTKNVLTCVDIESVKMSEDGQYECIMIVDRMGQQSEMSRKRLSGEEGPYSWSLVEANEIENWRSYYKSVLSKGFCQNGTPIDDSTKIVTVFRNAMEKRSINECVNYAKRALNPVEWITYKEKIKCAWTERYKEIRARKRVGDLYPVKEESGCIIAIMNWIKEVFLGEQSRPKTLFVVGETRSGKSMTVSNFLIDKDWIEYQAFDVSAKDRYGEQKVFRILDDATFGIHTVDVLKMYMNSVDSNVNVKYGETVIVPIPTIILLNKANFVQILNEFSDKQWLGGNIVVYPEQVEDTFKTHFVYESNISEMAERLYDETKPMLDSVKWEDTMFFKALNITEKEFKEVFERMKIGDDIWKEVRKYLRNRN